MEENGDGEEGVPVAVEACWWGGAEVLQGAVGEARYFYVIWMAGVVVAVTFLGRSVLGAMAGVRRSLRRWSRHFDGRQRARRSRGCRALSSRTADVMWLLV